MTALTVMTTAKKDIPTARHQMDIQKTFTATTTTTTTTTMSTKNDSNSNSNSNNDSDSDKDSDATQDNLYEVSMDGLEARTPKSTILPIYNAEIAGTTRKAIIDSGASTLYISQRAAEELGLQMTHVKARRVKVADHSRSEERRVGKECRSRW